MKRRPRGRSRKVNPASDQPAVSPVNVQSTIENDPSASILRQADAAPGKIDKSKLTFGEPRGRRDKAHLKFVANPR
jgi:hypothetical protein